MNGIDKCILLLPDVDMTFLETIDNWCKVVFHDIITAHCRSAHRSSLFTLSLRIGQVPLSDDGIVLHFDWTKSVA